MHFHRSTKGGSQCLPSLTVDGVEGDVRKYLAKKHKPIDQNLPAERRLAFVHSRELLTSSRAMVRDIGVGSLR